MVNENLIKQTITVFSEIQKKLVSPTFKFSQGGATLRTIANFLDSFEKEFGAITKERLVDFCINTAYAYRDKERTVKQWFGPISIKRFKEKKNGMTYYEDLWLSSGHINREYLINLIIDRQKHPLSKYIHVEAEEGTKKRLLNQDVGYLLCQTSTLGWSPMSDTCRQCNFINKCKRETQVKYPELYRIRYEYGETN